MANTVERQAKEAILRSVWVKDVMLEAKHMLPARWAAQLLFYL
jgi:hypothetical protein